MLFFSSLISSLTGSSRTCRPPLPLSPFPHLSTHTPTDPFPYGSSPGEGSVSSPAPSLTLFLLHRKTWPLSMPPTGAVTGVGIGGGQGPLSEWVFGPMHPGGGSGGSKLRNHKPLPGFCLAQRSPVVPEGQRSFCGGEGVASLDEARAAPPSG